ncbi:MAG: pyruvate formate-lyase-activating protein [Candidatus Daviesbacteria bacterium]|nr:pyruvate formate-lyase-activating protein [Candidatus Daviesbacteria bacterium]
MLNIHSIETFGTHEGPGIRLVVFLQGCNFRCLYCHNPDTRLLKGGKLMKSGEIIELLKKQKPYFKDNGGLTISGGEALLQRRGLLDLFIKAKKAGFNTCLDTNGSILDETAKKLLEKTDLVLLDVKHIDPIWHQTVTQTSNESVLQFAKYLEKIAKPMWLRYVLVPGYTNQKEFLHQWGAYFAKYENIQRVEILPFHTYGFYKYKELGIKNPLEDCPVPTKEEIKEAYDIFKQYFKSVYIR